MSIKRALDSILEGNLDEMRQNFSSALTTKAVEKLEERKIDIAKNYFGQMQEEVEQVDEALPGKKLVPKYGPLPDSKPLRPFGRVVDDAIKSAKSKQQNAVKKKK